MGACTFVIVAMLQQSMFAVSDFRPPAVPLATVDPYCSVWSFSDHLYDSWPQHWTGAIQAMAGMIRVDGNPMRFMGPETLCKNAVVQKDLYVLPTMTCYEFTAGPVDLTVQFMTPMLPNNLDLISRPVTYITFETKSNDGKQHDVQLYFDVTGEWVVDKPDQAIVWDRPAGPAGLTLLRLGSKEQPILEKSGDDRRIDWGHLYLAVPESAQAATALAKADESRQAFRDTGRAVSTDLEAKPRKANDDWPVAACALPLGAVESAPVQRHILLAYDDIYSIEFMGQKLRPWWFKVHGSFNAMLEIAARQYNEGFDATLDKTFNKDLALDALNAGGPAYADLLTLSYRHVFASGKIVEGPDGQPWFFHKECFSNGCIATVDVSYPAAPFFALFAPELLKGMMKPIFTFAQSGNWKWPFAPHDVGTYPKANGQVYNTEKLEGQMPVEECGNMIVMAALAVDAEGKPDFAQQNWTLLTQWANYLKEKGLDPENQLCTDDFAGHLAHNTNLSLKAIVAIGAYAQMADKLGKPEAAAYWEAARAMAAKWPGMAADGEYHYRLAFDKPGTWSLKYNLVWDKLLGLNLFSPDIARKEVAHYIRTRNTYGTPLDNRKAYTKADWLVWAATMAEAKADFESLVRPLRTFCDETPDRCPFTDWYDTKDATCVGFRARPVIGGIYIKLLDDPALRHKWNQ